MQKDTDLTKIIMNPARMRIVQYLMIHNQGTAAQIGEDLNDIPQASLYRHIKILENAGLILVIQENKKRGTLEKVYELNQNNPLGDGASEPDNLNQLFQSILLGIMSDFQRYFKKGNIEPEKDLISLSSSTLLLSDNEMKEFYMKVGEVYNQVIGNRPREDRKLRRITLISSPIDRPEKHKEEK